MADVVWPGRMQKLTQGSLVDLAPEGAEIWLDGGHNPGAGIVVAEAMAEQEEKNPRPLFLISGMINTKDQSGYFRAFKGLARHVYTVPVSMSDAGVPNDELAVRATEAGLSAEPVSSVASALMLLRDTWVTAQEAVLGFLDAQMVFDGQLGSAIGSHGHGGVELTQGDGLRPAVDGATRRGKEHPRAHRLAPHILQQLQRANQVGSHVQDGVLAGRGRHRG